MVQLSMTWVKYSRVMTILIQNTVLHKYVFLRRYFSNVYNFCQCFPVCWFYFFEGWTYTILVYLYWIFSKYTNPLSYHFKASSKSKLSFYKTLLVSIHPFKNDSTSNLTNVYTCYTQGNQLVWMCTFLVWKGWFQSIFET